MELGAVSRTEVCMPSARKDSVWYTEWLIIIIIIVIKLGGWVGVGMSRLSQPHAYTYSGAAQLEVGYFAGSVSWASLQPVLYSRRSRQRCLAVSS